MIADAFLVSDPVFYDTLERMDDAQSAFELTRRAAPDGWARGTRHVWVGLQPKDLELPRQGWKIHVSAALDDAERVLDEVWRYCVAHRLTFKFLRSRKAQLVTNLKYAERGASGKLAVIYPEDEARLRRTLHDLDAALRGTPGPYVLSDVRFKDGPLYARYGAFLDEWVDDPETGEPELCIRRPDGTPDPDVRRPVFRVPDWVRTPDYLETESAAADFPYDVIEALHFSNAGGVYLADEVATGRRVVLKEARPHAGLDPSGADAVSRLRRERRNLERLAGTGVAPELLGSFTAWEHHFIVEEHVEGTTLQAEIPLRYPYVHPEPSADTLREYTEWALGLVRDVEHAIARVHERGLVFGDLHPGNIQVRSGGGVALLDLELAAGLDEELDIGLGDPGFRTPAISSGPALDRYALGCLRIYLFMPVTALLYWGSDVARRLLAEARTRFPGLPPDFERETLRLMGVTGRSPRRRTLPPEDLIDALSLTIERSATPSRSDRLFPGAVEQFSHGALGLAYGAAGVLCALQDVRPDRCRSEHVDWLADAADRTTFHRPGLYDGAAGVAYALDRLGRPARELAERSLEQGLALRRADLFSGLAGIGLSALHWGFLDEARGIGERLEALVRDAPSGDIAPRSAGLMRGWSGLALFLTRLHELTGDESPLDAARLALARDLERCRVAQGGALHVDEGYRLLLYLNSGAIGVGVALRRYLALREEPAFQAAVDAIRRTCDIDFFLFPGLFDGRAGVIAGLSLLDPPGPERDARVAHQLAQLQWHLVEHDGGIAVPGDGLVRLSMDLATGAAGVLLATHAATAGGGEVLPLVTHSLSPLTP